MGDYGSRTEEHFNYKSLADFVDIDDIKKTILTIKSSKDSLYKKYKEVIDIFLKDFDNREITG